FPNIPSLSSVSGSRSDASNRKIREWLICLYEEMLSTFRCLFIFKLWLRTFRRKYCTVQSVRKTVVPDVHCDIEVFSRPHVTYLKEKFGRMKNDTKLKAGIFIGPEIGELICFHTNSSIYVFGGNEMKRREHNLLHLFAPHLFLSSTKQLSICSVKSTICCCNSLKQVQTNTLNLNDQLLRLYGELISAESPFKGTNLSASRSVFYFVYGL
ncbi:hypothetical protein L9F63_017040, partial [Diploptera punctata]